MNPFGYVKTHWHALLIGAVVWHFASPYVLPQVMGVVGGGTSRQS